MRAKLPDAAPDGPMSHALGLLLWSVKNETPDQPPQGGFFMPAKRTAMNTTSQHAAETVGGVVAKVAPPATVSVATVAGMQVSDLVLWATLIYTSLMIGHKVWQIIKEIRGKGCGQ